MSGLSFSLSFLVPVSCTNKFLTYANANINILQLFGRKSALMESRLGYWANVTGTKTKQLQASSTRYFLRVVTVVVVTVTSLTIVPNSSCSDSVCWVRVVNSPAVSPSYRGGELEPRISDNSCEGVDAPSTFTGINFQTRQDATPSDGGLSAQSST